MAIVVVVMLVLPWPHLPRLLLWCWQQVWLLLFIVVLLVSSVVEDFLLLLFGRQIECLLSCHVVLDWLQSYSRDRGLPAWTKVVIHLRGNRYNGICVCSPMENNSSGVFGNCCVVVIRCQKEPILVWWPWILDFSTKYGCSWPPEHSSSVKMSLSMFSTLSSKKLTLQSSLRSAASRIFCQLVW